MQIRSLIPRHPDFNFKPPAVPAGRRRAYGGIFQISRAGARRELALLPERHRATRRCRTIDSGDGKSSLVISPNCPRLIEALQCYHYPDAPGAAGSEQPFKDGVYDHPIDALRYFFVNRRHSGPTKTRVY